jgi:hypothetical protein
MPRRRHRPNPHVALTLACAATAAASALAGLFALVLVVSWPFAPTAADGGTALSFLAATLVLMCIIASALATRAVSLCR